MTLWEICLDGSPYSHHYSNLRSPKHAARILREWRERAQFSRPGVLLPEAARLTARTYTHTALDYYGVGRRG